MSTTGNGNTDKIDSSTISSEPPNYKIVFDKLNSLIVLGDWESFLLQLLESHRLGFPIDFQDEGQSLLHHAASKMQVECVGILIKDFGADPDIKTGNGAGSTPIHLLANSDCRCSFCVQRILSCLEILIDFGGAQVNAEDGLGETPLYSAARNRLAEPAAMLLGRGANINHWVNGTSVATLLAQFLPEVLKLEFDKYISIVTDSKDEGQPYFHGLRLDFSLLLQSVAVEEGLTIELAPSNSKFKASKRVPDKNGSPGEETVNFLEKRGNKRNERNVKPDKAKGSPSVLSSKSSLSADSSLIPSGIPPKETELLNFLLKADDLPAIEAIVDHPFVEAFVYLKWLSVRKFFFVLRSLYLFLISLYTFYVFDTFLSPNCFYNTMAAPKSNPDPVTWSPLQPSVRNEPETSARMMDYGSSGSKYNFYYWHTFSDYFKAHEMNCVPELRTRIMAYVFASYAGFIIFREFYKLFGSESRWYDYFKQPLNFAWWVLAVNISVTVTPGLGVYAHSWHYPYAAFSLIYGWILLLAQVERMPYLGTFVGVFTKVLKDFVLLLLTFSPVLVAFALGFSVILPQHEFFRFIPTALFKVFLMMTGDVDFWGVFKGTWTSVEYQGHVYIPLFIIYSVYVLIVTMVLMSLLTGLAVDDIQEVRRKADLYRTVNIIKEIGIFESMLRIPFLSCCGVSGYFLRLFSITRLGCMNGPELIIFPENPKDQTLSSEIKRKLVPYLSKCCCNCGESEHSDIAANANTSKFRRGQKQTNGITILPKSGIKPEVGTSTVSNKLLRARFFQSELNKDGSEASRPDVLFPNAASPTPEAATPTQTQQLNRGQSHDLLRRDLELYQEIKSLLEENEAYVQRLEQLKRKLLLGRK